MDEFVKSEHTVQVELAPDALHKGYIEQIQEQLKTRYENKCHPKIGYIKKGSVKMLKKAQGTLHGSHLSGKVTFTVTFSCQATKPNVGSVIVCMVTKKNGTGLLAVPRSSLPYDILISRSLEDNEHNQALIDSVNVTDTIEVVVVDSKLNAGDKKNKNSRYLIVGKINKTNIANEKLVQLVSMNPIDSLVSDISVVDSVDSHEPWIRRSEYINQGGISYTDLAAIKNQVGELNKKAIEVGLSPAGREYWDKIKMLINDYELVTKMSVLKEYTVSRAFYKMHELIMEGNDRFNILKRQSMRILNLAESPGGFIQAILYNRKYHLAGEGSAYADNYVAVSIQEGFGDKKARPSSKLWQSIQDKIGAAATAGKKEFSRIEFHQLGETDKLVDSDKRGFGTVHFVPGKKGDLTKLETIGYIEDQLGFGERKADLVTADGGMDVSDKPNMQEIAHYKLFFCEMLAALNSQALGGTFVLKLYDIFTEFTAKLIGFISMFYSDTYLYKPITSRQANSEKYLVCTGFNGIKPQIIEALKKILENWPEDEDGQVISVLNIDLAADFIGHLKAYNAKFAQIEWHNIHDGLERANEFVDLHKRGLSKEIDKRVEAREAIQKKESASFLTSVLRIDVLPA